MGGSGSDMAMIEHIWAHLGSNKSTNMSHIGVEKSTHVITDFPQFFVIQVSRIGREPGNNQLGFKILDLLLNSPCKFCRSQNIHYFQTENAPIRTFCWKDSLSCAAAKTREKDAY